MEDDLILGEDPPMNELDIIESQVQLIISLYDIDPQLYPDMDVELKMTLSKSFAIINRAQKKLLTLLK